MQQPYGQHARLQIESFRLKFWPLITSGSYPHKVCRQVTTQSGRSSKSRISNGNLHGTRNLMKSTGKFTSRENKHNFQKYGLLGVHDLYLFTHIHRQFSLYILASDRPKPSCNKRISNEQAQCIYVKDICTILGYPFKDLLH